MTTSPKPGNQGDVEPAEKRAVWTKRIEFIMACIGYAVGLGNVWRFPYLCYSSGGGAFLIPYFVMLLLCGVPLLYMELAVGQYTRQGPIGAIAALCPLFKGAGYGTVMLSFLLATYYNVIIAWALYYTFHSFYGILPWSNCNNDWNTEKCWDNYTANASFLRPNDTNSPSEEFFENYVLEQTDSFEDPGTLRWQLALLLVLAWAMVYFALFKGIKLTGKIVYFTATFPYVVLIILLVRGVTLPGSLNGILYFLQPDWSLLLDAKVWIAAAAQNFNSIGIAFGCMIAWASYNPPNTKIFGDVMKICVLNSFTSIMAGFAIFSILGHIAFNQGKEVDDVVTQGPGLVFVVYPEAFNSMPYPLAQMFAVLFFLMLLFLGIDSQFGNVEVIVTSLEDHLPPRVWKYVRRKEILVLIVCLTSMLLGFPCVMQNGIYFFKLIDYYSSGISLMYIAFFEVIAIAWFYGVKNLSKNVAEMTGSPPPLFFRICWYFFGPVLIGAICIFNWIQYEPVKYDDYTYPIWGQVLGWCMSFLSLICVPIGMVHAIYTAKGDTCLQKLKMSVKPVIKGDADETLDNKNNIYAQNIHDSKITMVSSL